jgi:hypothetical protein
MANTVSTISYANTFGQWMVATDALIAENNTIATGDYVKDSGTLYLSENTKNALQSNGNIVIQKQLLVQGAGSSANIDNNLGIGGQVYFSNTILGLTNAGQANINGLLVAQASGLSLSVANNTTMGGNNTIRYGVTANTVQANISINTATASVTGTTYTNVLSANGSVIGAVGSFSGDVYVSNIQANTGVITPYLQSNNYVNTAALTVSTTTTTGTLNAFTKVTTGIVQANTSVNTSSISVTGGAYTNTLAANTSLTAPTVTISSLLDANSAAGYIGSLQTVGQLSVGGNFVINGTTVYNSNTFTLNAGSGTAQISSITVNRGSSGGSNAAIRWNETSKYFDILNITSNNFNRILTDEYLSSSLSDTSTSNVATANLANTIYTTFTAANNFLQAGVSSAGSYGNSAFSRANTSANTIVGTTGSITASSGSVRFTSNNGLTAVATTANTLAISTSQDLRTSASPTFAGLTLTSALSIPNGGTGATSAGDALTGLLPSAVGVISGYVLATNGPGSYYWASAPAGGGGAAPGTSINSTRLTYTGNQIVTAFTAPTYTPGANQLRVFINGIRQAASTYTETNATTVTFNTAPATGAIILLEVDGYILNPYYANNIPYTINSTISGSANTIQLAVDGLTSIVALKSGTTFTGRVFGLTPTLSNNDTTMATTAFVYNALANTDASYTHSITGNAGTVTGGVYTYGSYANPSWITSIANTKIDGSITNAQIASLATSKLTGTVTSDQLASVANSKITGTMAATQLSNTITYGITVSNATSATSATSASSSTTAGTADSANALNTSNNYRMNSLGVGTAASGTSGEIRAINNITAYYSDDNLKTRIGNIENALEKVMSLNGFYYEANEAAQALGYTVKREVGVSAQEVQKILPEIVVPAPIDDKYLTVHYEKLIPLLIESIKELKAEIDVLKKS